MRWVWLQKTEPHRPWAILPFHVLEQVSALFSVAVISIIGDGANTLFWTDQWLHRQCIADLAPRLFVAIPKRKAKRRTVRDALTNRAWISDLQGARIVGVVVDFFYLWNFSCSRRLRIDTCGVSPPMDNTRLSWLMKVSFWDLLFLDHGKGSGNLGRHPNVASLCGWLRTISVGQLIAWHVVGFLIRSFVPSVTKKRRLSTTSLSTVFSQENSSFFCSDRSVFRACLLSP
jgi:hypothetical protein